MSDELRFTPGPWRHHGRTTGEYSNTVEDKQGRSIADVLRWNDWMTGPGNAKLIAAAPDLYYALAAIVADGVFDNGWRQIAEVALAKARGEVMP